MNLDMQKVTEDLVIWIKEQLKSSGGNKIILGISGGKDSSVAAALCALAIGKENVYGVLMPDGIQQDIEYAHTLVETIGINQITLNLENVTSAFKDLLNQAVDEDFVEDITKQTSLNLPPRVRMTLVHALSQSINDARVINTGNLSEKWIGYTTVYGDNTGAFAPLAGLTSDEVMDLGIYLGLPDFLAFKAPSDGLTGKTDEDVIGFSYEVLNKYIRTGEIEDQKIKEKIDYLHKINEFKFKPIPSFPSPLPVIGK